jgi:hypothetical protein
LLVVLSAGLRSELSACCGVKANENTRKENYKYKKNTKLVAIVATLCV